VLLSLASGACLDLAMAPYAGKGTGETTLLRQMYGSLHRGDVLVADALFDNYFLVWELRQRGIELVARVQAERVGSQTVERKSDSEIIVWRRPGFPRGMSWKTYLSYPETMTMRQVSVDARDKNNRAERFKVITTILDASCPCGKGAKVDPPADAGLGVGQDGVGGAGRAAWVDADLRWAWGEAVSVVGGLSCRVRLEVVSQRLEWLTGDESNAIVVEHGRAPGDDFGHRQVALLEGLEDHAQALFDVLGHHAFVAHLDLIAPFLHQFQREPHCQPQLARSDQAAQVSFHFTVGFVVVVEVAVDVPLVEVGRVGDGLTRRGSQFVWCSSHVEPGGKLPENPAVRLGQFQQDIDQFRFLSPA
jgi:hypothetical protein